MSARLHLAEEAGRRPDSRDMSSGVCIKIRRHLSSCRFHVFSLLAQMVASPHCAKAHGTICSMDVFACSATCVDEVLKPVLNMPGQTIRQHNILSEQAQSKIGYAEEKIPHRNMCREPPRKTMMHSTAQHSTAQLGTAQHGTARHSTAQHSTAQHSTAQHSTAQGCTWHKAG